MLLKHLYDFAISRNLLDDLAFKSDVPVRWIIPLDSSGQLKGSGLIETLGTESDGASNRGKLYSVPKTTRATNSGEVADFLVDDIGAIFGLRTKFDKDKASGKVKPEKESVIKKRKAKNADFWRQIQIANDAIKDDSLFAILQFRENNKNNPLPFIHLNADGTAWLVKTATGDEKKLGNDFFGFSVDGQIIFIQENIRAYWKSAVEKELAENEKNALKGVCLVTGQTDVSLARTHIPMITGLPKTHKKDQIKSRGIVGFDKQSPAFSSYGFSQAYNAPTSIMASKAYLAALQYLTGKDDHWLPMGKYWFCFWAKSSDDVSSRMGKLLKQPDTRTIRNFLVSPWSGLPKPPPADDKFFTFSFTASGPRLVIKTWSKKPLKEVELSLKHWFEDLMIDTVAQLDDSNKSVLGIPQLANITLPLKQETRRLIPDIDKLQPEILSQLYRAALENTAPTVALIKPVLNQLHSRLLDKDYKIIYDESRFALLKLILNRNRKENEMKIKPELTVDTDDAAYNCGRLLSVFAAAQRKALRKSDGFSSVAERFYGTASVSPASVFPRLFALNRHHLEKISKSRNGAERFLKEKICAICANFKSKGDGLPPELPRILTLQEQGRFALGFYQQQAADAIARDEACVLFYLKETNPTTYNEVVELREKDPAAFSERVNSLINPAREWANQKRKEQNVDQTAPNLFVEE
jgi:CRISPR-associated protein Csd1